MGLYTAIASCSIGGSGFQLSDWGLSSEPLYGSEGQLTGRRTVISGEGWVEAASASAFAAAVLAATAAFSVHGVDVVVKGLGEHAEAQILAAQCINDGPFVTVSIMPQGDGAALHKRFSFTATGEAGAGGEPIEPGGMVGKLEKLAITSRADGMWRVRMSGELKGPDADRAYELRVAAARTEYPWPGWTLSEDTREQNATRDHVTYVLVADELVGSLVEAGAGRAVDGTSTEGIEQDEHNRIVRTYTWDLLVDGDPWALEPVIRPRNGVVIRSRYDTTNIRERRLRASWTVLESQNGTGLLEWVQSFSVPIEDVQGRVESYEGVRSIIVYTLASAHRVVQQGRAVGLMRYPKAPKPVTIAGYVLERDPEVRHARINDYELETSWSYAYVGTRGLGPIDVMDLLAGSRRPNQPEFV